MRLEDTQDRLIIMIATYRQRQPLVIVVAAVQIVRQVAVMIVAMETGVVAAAIAVHLHRIVDFQAVVHQTIGNHSLTGEELDYKH